MNAGLIALAAVLSGVSAVQDRDAKVLRVLEDFETQHHYSPKIEPQDPKSPIQVEYARETPFGRRCLRVAVSPDWDWKWKGWDGNGPARVVPSTGVCVLSGPFLPPEADAVRMKVKVLSGRFIFLVGGATTHQGNSDAFSVTPVEAAPGAPEWRTVELSLNHGLVQNCRRPEFGKDAPMIYLTRWPHELIGLSLGHPSHGEALLDDIELVSRGEGRPFPAFDERQVETIRPIADFERDPAAGDAYRVCYGILPSLSFWQSYARDDRALDPNIPRPYEKALSSMVREEGIRHPAPRLGRVEGARPGRKALSAECYWMEECQMVAVKTEGEPRANALRFVLKAQYPVQLFKDRCEFEYDGKSSVCVDFVVFVGPAGEPFPWDQVEASEELKKAFAERNYAGPGSRYDYFFHPAPTPLTRGKDLKRAGSIGWYQARRFIPRNAWATTVVPFADFVCVYGQGSLEERWMKQAPLDGAQVKAVAFLAPYSSNQGTIAVDEIAYVKVPGKPEELRSFWQHPDMSRVKLFNTRWHFHDTWKYQSEGEPLPEYLK
jgi:hypothetical protein